MTPIDYRYYRFPRTSREAYGHREIEFSDDKADAKVFYAAIILFLTSLWVWI